MNKTHGATVGRRLTPEYRAWRNMISRCKHPSTNGFHNYGGRGISVCGRWNKFENFLSDVGRRPSKNHSLGRLDNDGNYEPSNVGWQTEKEQRRNRRDNVVVEFRGQKMILADAIKLTGIPFLRAWWRLRHGWPVDKALQP